MCRSTVDIKSVTTEIKQGIIKKKKKEEEEERNHKTKI